MLTKLKLKLMPVWVAMMKQRVAVAIVIGIGILVALFAPVAPPVSDIGSRDVTVANVAVAGFEPPCTAASLPAFTKSGEVLTQVKADTGLTLNAAAISTQLRAPGVMAIRYTGPAGSPVTARALDVANAVVAKCNGDTTAQLTALGDSLKAVEVQRQRDLAAVDAELIPATQSTSQSAVLSKRLDALQTQLVDAKQKAAVQDKLADAADKQRAALLPVAAREVQAGDSLMLALRAQRDKDKAALEAAKAQYREYPGLDGLQHRVEQDEHSMQQRAAALAPDSQTLSPAYRAAQAASDQARAAADAQHAQVDTIAAQVDQLTPDVAKLNAVGVTVAADTRKRDALPKAYQAVAAQHYAVEQAARVAAEPATAPDLVGGPLAVAPQPPEPVVETQGKKLALAVRIAVALAFVVFAAIVAVVLDAYDRRLLTVDAFTKLYGKPVIATLGPGSHA